MAEKNEACPCKRLRCTRYGDCAACRMHHMTEKKTPPACARVKRKTEGVKQT